MEREIKVKANESQHVKVLTPEEGEKQAAEAQRHRDDMSTILVDKLNAPQPEEKKEN